MAETTAAPRPPRALVATALVAVGVVVAAFVLQLVSDDPPAPRVIAAHLAIGAVWLARRPCRLGAPPDVPHRPADARHGRALAAARPLHLAGRAVGDLRDDDRLPRCRRRGSPVRGLSDRAPLTARRAPPRRRRIRSRRAARRPAPSAVPRPGRPVVRR